MMQYVDHLSVTVFRLKARSLLKRLSPNSKICKNHGQSTRKALLLYNLCPQDMFTHYSEPLPQLSDQVLQKLC